MLNNLTNSDIQGLRNCFISDALIETAQLRRVGDIEGAELVGRKPNANTNHASLVFTYFFPTDGNTTQYRLRLDEPQGENGKIKYLTAPGTCNMLYFIPGVNVKDLNDNFLPLAIFEGEKKALAGENLSTYKTDSRRFVPVGISGVWNWKGKISKTANGVIPCFQQIKLKNRDVILIFDSDVATNKNVEVARMALAEHLHSEGARVFLVDIPISEGNKIGFDDLLGKWQAEKDTDTAVEKGLELLASKRPFKVGELKESLFDGKLFLEAEADERGKTKITARDENQDAIEIDSFNLKDQTKRVKFIRSLGFDKDQQTEIARALINFADRVETISGDSPTALKGEIVQTSFQVLKDGRIIDQIRGGLAVYDDETNSHSIEQIVTDSDGTIYEPINDDLLKVETGGIYTANALSEYQSTTELIKEIEAYVYRYVDLKPLFLKLASYYILFTYVFDKVLELSYVTATGDLGSGKSRFGCTCVLASYRGFIMVNPTAATLYRTIDRFSPTLFIDEFNGKADGENEQAVIQVLNTGISKLATISRQVKDSNGNFKTETFNPYCPKIIGSYKASASDALKSRNIEIQMEKSTRNNLPIRLTPKMLEDAQKIRNKAQLWRLEHYKDDLEEKLNKAEAQLRNAGISLRSVQINIPLFALIEDDDLKADFIELLQGRDKVLSENKKQSFDGELIETIHSFIFDVDVDANEKVKTIEWILKPKPEHLSVCTDILVPKITDRLNNDREDKKNKISTQLVGKTLVGLGLVTKKINSRNDKEIRGKKALIFDYERLKVLFDNFILPYPDNFNVANVAAFSNGNKTNGLSVATYRGDEGKDENIYRQSNSTNESSYRTGDIGDIKIDEIKQTKKNGRTRIEL